MYIYVLWVGKFREGIGKSCCMENTKSKEKLDANNVKETLHLQIIFQA